MLSGNSNNPNLRKFVNQMNNNSKTINNLQNLQSNIAAAMIS